MSTDVTTVTLGDGRQIGVIASPGSGPAYVLLHGLLDDAHGWKQVTEQLGHAAFAIDLPGFGRSSLPTRPRLSAYADDVLETLDALGIGRAVVVGHSLGGAVAAAIADRAPDRVEALVLLAPAGFGRIGLAEAVAVPGVRDVAKLVLPRALGHRGATSLVYRAMVSNGAAADPDLLERLFTGRASAGPGALASLQAIVAAGTSPRAFARRRIAYDGPVTALWGTHDRLVPWAHAAGVSRALPQARVERWLGMGHHPQRERLDALVRLLSSVSEPRPGRSRRAA